MLKIFRKDSPPDFINEEGVKWWIDKETTQYATREDINGISLDYQVWVIEKPNGYKTRIILNEKRKPIFDSQQLENIAFEIEKRKMIKYKC